MNKYNGLSSEEANARLKTEGYNELPASGPKNIWRIAMDVVKEPMFLLLISCGVLYMLLGDYREGAILVSATLIIIFITFYQSQKTEKALAALKNMSSPRALVIRNGSEIRIPGREVVRGDLMVLQEGDRIAADAVLEDSMNLHIDESLLSGESFPVEKLHSNSDATMSDLVYSGSLIVQGNGLATVTATGIKTEFGKIGSSLVSIKEDETSLQKEMKILIGRLFITGIALSVFVVVAFYLSGGDFIHALLNGLAAAMAILPEEFPVVLTVFLALGAWRLSKKKVLCRKPSAIETLGSATVLCSDKTGTITMNKMEVVKLYYGSEIISVSDINEKINSPALLLETAVGACQKGSPDPTEKAIEALGKLLPFRDGEELLKEYPFSREFPCMSRVLKSGPDKLPVVCSKGAPETIFELCGLSKEEIEKHSEILAKLASSGYRVLGVANAVLDDGFLPENQNGFKPEFTGLIALEDPVRPGVRQAVKECMEAGVKVVMITGDYPLTAKSISEQIGLSKDGELMSGAELNQLSDSELSKRISNVSVFARVVPEQKLRIVTAYKAANEIVAMTGDGVNDAPALKAAHIGIAMGMKGTDVAREASSLVLLDDQFDSIVSAIRNGRKIFDNLQKAMSYILAIHIPIIGLTLLPAFFPDLPVILLPLHIIFMELIIDPVCSVAFESEEEEKDIMIRPPRNPDEAFFGFRKISHSILRGLLLLILVIIVYYLSIKEGHDEKEIRAITFSALIFGNMALILTSLSKTRYVYSVLIEKNISLILILSLALLILIAILFLPFLQTTFSLSMPGIKHFLPAIFSTLALLSLLELIKFFRLKFRNR